MSRAFVREDAAAAADTLPDRPVSPHPNLVTPQGLVLLESRVRALKDALREARASGDELERATLDRDLRYFTQRLASAQVVETPSNVQVLRFGATVLLRLPDGCLRRLRIVGEDEADPAAGTVSYVSPIARELLGRRPGDTVAWGPGGEAVIAAIET